MPKHVALGLMFGSPVAFTVPDLDRTDYLVVIGANPLVSNGSVTTAADFPGKLRALRKRGGRLVVIDPARTRTAELADRHLAPRPGHRRGSDARRRARALRRGPGRPRDSGRPCQRCRRRPRCRSRLRARHRRRLLRHRRGGDPDAGPRARRRPDGGRLRPNRYLHSRIRNARQLARRRHQHPDRQSRPAGRGDVPPRRRGPRAAATEARSRASRSGAGTAGSPAIPKRCRNSRPPRSPRRSRRPATGRSRR